MRSARPRRRDLRRALGLGEEGIQAVALEHVDEPPSEVLRALVARALQFGGDPNKDDIAAIALKPTGA